jgi:DNA-binding transcriptional LysR family regulator
LAYYSPMLHRMDKLTGFVVFARVVEGGSFTAAAQSLRLSVSAVAKSVGQLESVLGVRLLNRTTRSMALTAEGQLFYEHCRIIVAQFEAAENAMARTRELPRGELHIQAPPALARLHIIPALPQFLARNPELSVRITQSSQIIDLVKNGIDLAFWVGDIPDSGMIVRRLTRSGLVTCASPAYLDKHGRPADIDDLRHHNCLVATAWGIGPDWSFVTPRGPLTVTVTGNLEIDSGDTYRDAALSGLGIIQSSSFLVGPDIRSGALEAILTEYLAPGNDVVAVYPSRQHLLPKVSAFLEFVAELIELNPDHLPEIQKFTQKIGLSGHGPKGMRAQSHKRSLASTGAPPAGSCRSRQV